MVGLLGCAGIDSQRFDTLDHSLVYRLSEQSYSQLHKPSSDQLVTFSANGMRLTDFAFWLSRKTGKGLVYSEDLDNKTITADLINCSLPDLMEFVSRRLGVSVRLQGSTYYLGQLRDTDRSFYIRKVYSYPSDQIQGFISTVSGYSGRCYCSPDGVLVVSDNSAVITQVQSVIDSLEDLPVASWVVQFYVVQFHDDASFSAGFDGLSSGDLSLLLTKGAGLTFDYHDLGLKLSAVLAGRATGSAVLASPLFVLRDGKKATWSDGSEVPVPNKTVSDAGTVTTSGYSRIKTGLGLTVSLRESVQGALIDFELTDSSITSYIEYAPVLTLTELSSCFSLVNSNYVLAGELLRRTDGSGVTQLFSFEKKKQRSRVLVFARGYRSDLLPCDDPSKIIPGSSAGAGD